jgi:hypothetical protein
MNEKEPIPRKKFVHKPSFTPYFLLIFIKETGKDILRGAVCSELKRNY